MEDPGRLQSMASWRVGHIWTTSLSHIGEGNGTPLQCSFLENPRDSEAWWAAIYGVSQSRTWLKWLSSSSSSKCWRWYAIGLRFLPSLLELRVTIHFLPSFPHSLQPAHGFYASPSNLLLMLILTWFHVFINMLRGIKKQLVFPGGSVFKKLPVMQKMQEMLWVWPLGQEDPLEKGKDTHSSILALENPMDRGGWWVIVLHRVGHNWSD